MAIPRDTVVLVHGLAAHPLWMKPLEIRLRRAGFDTVNFGYPSLRGRIELHAERLSEQLTQLARREDVTELRLVTHSMGGIVARAALLQGNHEKVSSMVMLGPPNHGSRVAAILARGLGWLCHSLHQLTDRADSFVNELPSPSEIPIGVIAARFDRVVAMESTHLTTQSDHRVVQSGHNRMLFQRDVAHHVAHFLREGRFVPTDGQTSAKTPAADTAI